MKLDRKDMLEIMDEINSGYVEEAGKISKPERRKSKCGQIMGNVIKYGFIAACLAIVIGAAAMRVLKYRENHLQSGSGIVPSGEQLDEETTLETAGKADGEPVTEETSVVVVGEEVTEEDEEAVSEEERDEEFDAKPENSPEGDEEERESTVVERVEEED